ncbi:hypothetical protein Mapa_006784 [Marchantia paleacea]|nr:hypothetical protein Mapa_006784 [Marchantia paleacea]
MVKFILQSMGLSLHVTSLSGRITYWNPMAEQLFGYSAEQAVGQRAVDLLCTDDSHDFALQICETTRTGISWSGRFPLRTSGGEDFTAVVCVSPLINDKAEVFGTISICSRLDSNQYLNDPPKQDVGRAESSPLQPVPELPSKAYSGRICMTEPEREGHNLSVLQKCRTSVRKVTENVSTCLVLASGWKGDTTQHCPPVESRSHVNHVSSSRISNLPDSSASSWRAELDQGQPAGFEIPWGEIKFGARIGEGSCGRVYHGTWLGSDVAVKMFSSGQAYAPELLHEFRREVSIMKATRHPNVLLFMGAITEPKHISIITEFVPRGSLFRILHRSKQGLSWNRRLRMALDVALGMNYLHHRSPPILHRDLKSSNLLVTENWKVKVGDFGLSRLKNSSFLTRMSDKGTAQWMAPEVLRNEPFSEKSDVYSFGVILWELATRQIPWGEMSLLEVIGAVGMLDRRLEIRDGIDPQYVELTEACWSSDSKLRPSFNTVVSRLKHMLKISLIAKVKFSSST